MPSPPPGVIYMGGMEAIGVRTASGGERGGTIHSGANRSRCAPGRSDKHITRTAKTRTRSVLVHTDNCKPALRSDESMGRELTALALVVGALVVKRISISCLLARRCVNATFSNMPKCFLNTKSSFARLQER
jgi:hypothetical protein